MPIQFPAELPLDISASQAQRGLTQLSHGELILAKVTRISPDGVATIRFANIDAQAQGGGLLQSGQRMFVHVQKTQDETVLSLLPNVREGDILSGNVERHTTSGGLVRLNESEFIVRLASTDAPPPPEGTPVRAQVQTVSGRPILQLLPHGETDTTLTGVFVAQREDGTVLINAEGTILVAVSAESVRPGDVVSAEIVQAGDRQLLQILQGAPRPDASAPEREAKARIEQMVAKLLAEPEYARLLGGLFSEETRIAGVSRELLQLIQQFAHDGERPSWILALAKALEAILLKPHEGNVAEQLPHAFEDSGIFMEQRLLQAAFSGEADAEKISDLKLALLGANQKLSDLQQTVHSDGAKSPHYIGDIISKVGLLLDTIKAEQLQNIRITSSNEIYIQLPFAHASGLEQVEIFISHQGKRPAKKIDPQNALLMVSVSTSNLGRIKASVSISNGQVGCRFKTNRESVARLLTSNADVLRQGLEKLDYRVAYIDCTLSKNEQELKVLDESIATPQKGLDLHL